MEEQIGEKIRSARLAKGFTLDDLSSRSGLSKSFISEIERGVSSMTITSLQKIAQALDLSLADFFQPPNSIPVGPKVTRKGEGKTFQLDAHESTIYTSLAANLPEKLLEPFFVTLLPRQKHRAQPYSHPGEEFGFVLEGTLTVIVEDKVYRLQPGDSIHLSSMTPHNWENETDEPVKALWVVTPKIF